MTDYGCWSRRLAFVFSLLPFHFPTFAEAIQTENSRKFEVPHKVIRSIEHYNGSPNNQKRKRKKKKRVFFESIRTLLPEGEHSCHVSTLLTSLCFVRELPTVDVSPSRSITECALNSEISQTGLCTDKA